MAVGPWVDFPARTATAPGDGGHSQPQEVRGPVCWRGLRSARESARALRPPREPVGSALSFPLEMESLLTSGGVRNSSREKCIAV